MPTPPYTSSKKTIDNTDDSFSPVKDMLQHPVAKIVLLGGGVVLFCYGAILFMNMATKVVGSYKVLDKTINT